jgi:hypothetical protein
MNDRISQLILQAGTDVSGKWISRDQALVLAQLIVAECAGLNRLQYYELLGVITDVESGDGFDDVCLATVKRVAEHLANDVKDYFGAEL